MKTDPATEATWAAILTAEPKLVALIAEAAIIAPSDWYVYEAYKKRLQQIVGWGAERPELRQCHYYALAVGKLAEALGL